MCFSPAASFAAAALLTGVGVATLAQRPEKKRLAFALIPLIFAVHQLIEGGIWLSLGSSGAPPREQVVAYLFLAQVFWPTYTPLSVLLMESEERRRWSLYILLAGGLVVSVAMAVILIQNDYTVRVVNHSLRYATDHEFEKQLVGLYVLATTAPLILSRHRYVMAFGGAVLAGSVITELAFHYTGTSVWCFFAAISSPLVFFHIRRQAKLARA